MDYAALIFNVENMVNMWVWKDTENAHELLAICRKAISCILDKQVFLHDTISYDGIDADYEQYMLIANIIMNIMHLHNGELVKQTLKA